MIIVLAEDAAQPNNIQDMILYEFVWRQFN